MSFRSAQDVVTVEAQGMKGSKILGVTARAKRELATGRDLVILAAGAPHFGPSPALKAAVRAAAGDDAQASYTGEGGDPKVVQAVADWYSTRLDMAVGVGDVVLTAGVKPALTMALMTVLDPAYPGEVLVAGPCWASYAEMAKTRGGHLKIVQGAPEDGFFMSPDQLADALTPRVKAVILNSPSNPTGMVLSREMATAYARVLNAYAGNVLVILDEIYSNIVFPGSEHVQLGAMITNQPVVIVDGISKGAFAPGWRVGWAVGSTEVIAAMRAYQGELFTHPSRLAMAAVIPALADTTYPAECSAYYAENARIAHERLRGCPGVAAAPLAQGAFYQWVALQEGIDGYVVHERLWRDRDVVVIPGEFFGAPNGFRISLACARGTLEKGLDRIAAGLAEM